VIPGGEPSVSNYGSPAIIVTDPRNGKHFRISANGILHVVPRTDGTIINIRGVGRVYAAESADEVNAGLEAARAKEGCVPVYS